MMPFRFLLPVLIQAWVGLLQIGPTDSPVAPNCWLFLFFHFCVCLCMFACMWVLHVPVYTCV